jgi:hypothetical protein
MVYGQRIYVFSGEFHPYRLTVPDLWLNIPRELDVGSWSPGDDGAEDTGECADTEICANIRCILTGWSLLVFVPEFWAFIS